MKGRKPDQNAVRRGLADSYAEMAAQPEGVHGLSMPDDIAADPVRSEIWSWICPPVNSFAPQDIPLLRRLVFVHAALAQCEQSMTAGDGTVGIFDKIGVKPFRTEDGREIPLVRENPAIGSWKKMDAEARALSDMLGLSPLARSRIGLMDATKVKTAADTAAMFRSIDAAYELPSEVADAED